MRFLCSLPYSCASHFYAHFGSLDDMDNDYASLKLIRPAKLKKLKGLRERFIAESAFKSPQIPEDVYCSVFRQLLIYC